MPARRSVLAGLMAASLAPRASWADAGSPAFVSAARTPAGDYVLCGLKARGEIAFQIPLPARGHAAAAHPETPHAVAFARRPGTFALVIDCATGAVAQRLTAPEGRHFYGHGTFAAGGDVLITTENDYEAGQGVLGLWDVRARYARIGEIASGGVGPHDIKLLPDGATLAVANGGIETHPETGRTKLNLPTMRPNLAYVTLGGAVPEIVELPEELRRNSIRHLAVDPAGRVGMAMQWQGDTSERVPLLAVHDRASGALGLSAPDADGALMGYAGSIAMDAGSVAITSPVGGIAQIHETATLALTAIVARPDICGIASSASGYVTTTGAGLFERHGSTPMERRAALGWDNHLIRLT